MNKKMIILDCGSGSQCNNDFDKVKKLIESAAILKSDKYDLILKWQLFDKSEELKSLAWQIFEYAYYNAKDLGLKTTASVFDEKSLSFLLQHDIPFVKLSARTDLYWLVEKIPEDIPILFSVPSFDWYQELKNRIKRKAGFATMCCIQNYPAEEKTYKQEYDNWALGHTGYLHRGLSDHTTNFNLFKEYQPIIWEKHFILKHGKTDDPYGDLFCATIEELSEVLREIV